MMSGGIAGEWFHGGGADDPGRAAERRWQVLSALVAQRRAQAADLQRRLANLHRQIASLEALKAAGAAPLLPEPVTGGEPSPRGFWSPVPILGFRMWQLAADGVYGAVRRWDGPRLEAVCRRGPGAPHEDECRCGIYAWSDVPGVWRARVPPLPIGVYGLVALSGKVIEHALGYRAQRAEVVAAALVASRGLTCGSGPEWLSRLFGPGPGWQSVVAAPGAFPRRAAAVPRGIDYLLQEARRFRESWTSESRSE